jgi:hypothetical protein
MFVQSYNEANGPCFPWLPGLRALTQAEVEPETHIAVKWWTK